jgi:hypothetical protein
MELLKYERFTGYIVTVCVAALVLVWVGIVAVLS